VVPAGTIDRHELHAVKQGRISLATVDPLKTMEVVDELVELRDINPHD
jgi:hypothetical protein